MKTLLVLVALVLPATGCVVGEGGESPPPGDDDPGPGPGPGPTPNTIDADTTFSGVVALDVATTISPGVTVTVMPGTTINVATGARLVVQGILDVQGTSASKIEIKSATEGTKHGGISLPAGGELRMTYGIQTGGGIFLQGGKATIVDTTLSNAGPPSSNGDFLIMSGGDLTMSFSEIGLATGDGTHCNMHFGGAGNLINITKSTIRGVPYGLMFYGGTGAIFTENNWENPINVDAQPGVSGDFSGSFFTGGPPTPPGGATLTLNNLAQAPIADARPRP